MKVTLKELIKEIELHKEIHDEVSEKAPKDSILCHFSVGAAAVLTQLLEFAEHGRK